VFERERKKERERERERETGFQHSPELETEPTVLGYTRF
jgi:hypothetical protein